MRGSKPQLLHLWIHQNYRVIRSWLATISVFLLLVLNIAMLMQLNGISQDNKSLLEAQEEVLGHQAKQSEEQKDIAQRNLDYTFCGFQQFSQYTRDRKPISDLDLEQCTRGTTVQEDQRAEAQTQPAPSNSSPTNSEQTPPQATTPPAPSQPTTSAPPEPEGLRRIPVIDSTLKLLGL